MYIWPLGYRSKLIVIACHSPSHAMDNLCQIWEESMRNSRCCRVHDDVTKWKHFPRDWPFVRGIHRSPVNSPHRGQWCEALMFSLICAWSNSWANNGDAGDMRCHCTHYDVTVMDTRSHIHVVCCNSIYRSFKLVKTTHLSKYSI